MDSIRSKESNMPNVREDAVAYPVGVWIYNRDTGKYERFAPPKESTEGAAERIQLANNELLMHILVELKGISHILNEGLNAGIDVETIRGETLSSEVPQPL
jgi:hypothetical protein